MAMACETSEEFADAVAAVQEGDLETVKSLVLSRIFHPNAMDRGQCTLLHWAAINNRIQIASFLVDHGAEILPGGILFETALQWAIRKRYYCMAELLAEKLHPDLSHRSRDGLDALHLACRLDDVNAVFLLLSWGAPPDTLDQDGLTPLLWLLQTNSCAASVIEMVRLLLRFGANALAVDSQGNNAMHLLCGHRQLDLSLALLLYQPAFANLTNRAGLTAYALSAQQEQRRLSRFLFDALYLHYFPYHLPTALTFSLPLLALLLVQRYGYLYGGLGSAALWLCMSWTLLQHHVYDHRCRSVLGSFLGIVTAAALVFRLYLSAFLPSAAQLCLLAVFVGAALSAYQFATTRPQGPAGSSRAALVAKIVASAPSEGTDEENDEDLPAGQGQAQQTITKDAFTGQILVSTPEGVGRGRKPRTLGPRLCGICLADKRAVTERGISIATHCVYCRACVADADHHCDYLNNCVGRGNRRAFVCFLFLAAFACLGYLLCLKRVQYAFFCDAAASPKAALLSFVWDKELCLARTFPALFLVQLLCVAMGSVFFGLGYNELIFVARETTLLNVMKGRYVSKPPSSAKQTSSIFAFLRSGDFAVTYPKAEDDMGMRAKRCEQQDQDQDHGHDHDHDHSHRDQHQPAPAASASADSSVRDLLARIESDMGIRSAGPTSVLDGPSHDLGHGHSHSQGVDSSSTNSRGKVKVAPVAVTPSRRPSDALTRPPQGMARDGEGEAYDLEQGRGGGGGGADEGGQDDDDDDYDAEFVASSVNAYRSYYWDEGCSGGHDHSHGHSHSHSGSCKHDHGDEERASLLRSR